MSSWLKKGYVYYLRIPQHCTCQGHRHRKIMFPPFSVMDSTGADIHAGLFASCISGCFTIARNLIRIRVLVCPRKY
ncbi:uncharacterized protein BT62DRAFT_444566 [Guyanagaster necrorhizus]|uniref:Uncharacterized protein n=1 Tax=Guyanagaster necrorhizus TaxID=856835 RepID=A0A9P7VKU3_9AGAR|nr:uncharacterized protein BT62DRAFT_444566 [Guyanagaster necrorhizus MCA 3950]KAG7442332.1 hypothetical protein BT62DRAFT_444566 [Guyanagaster necrorhizus MCA 3950]